MATSTKSRGAKNVKQPKASGRPDDYDYNPEDEARAREEKARRQGARQSGERAKTQREKMRGETRREGFKAQAGSERAKTRREKYRYEGRKAQSEAQREANRMKNRQANRRARIQEQESARKKAAQDARNEARAQQQAAARQRNRARATNALLGGSAGALSAPSTSTGTAPLVPSGPSKQTSSKVIIGAMIFSSIVVMYRAAKGGNAPPTKIDVKQNINGKQVQGAPLSVPNHLREFGGVLIMGTIALVVNEIDPGLGMAFGILILVDTGVAAAGRGGLVSSVGKNLFGAGTPAPALGGGGSRRYK